MNFIVAGNWKMNKGPKQAQEFFTEFAKTSLPEKTKVMFFVSPVNAVAASQADFAWGPQNIYPKASGAFTGETSPQVMQELGASYVLVGHSERRSLFNESDESCNQKIKAAQEFDLNPMLCIGESLIERKAGETLKVLDHQLAKALLDIEIKNELHIAYEPVWAIGTGEVASVEQVGEAHQFIREFLSNRFPQKHADIKILYGGSVKPESAGELSQVAEVGGFLVGGASLKPDSLHAIVKAAQ